MQEEKNFVGNLLDSRYMVTDVIGKGGSACVYRANDVLLNRAVALKILDDDKNELHINTKSFETEVRAIARLSHPNIVNVYDISMEGNIKYIVMECVDGITLSAYLKHKKVLPMSEAASCARQILRALREAHEKGIVHRDIKPQNIMIMKNGQIKVADFGIARLPDKDSFCMEDRSIGTVHYISPEQARGQAVDSRSDLYSLAIVMYEMLTGKRPFEAPSSSEVIMKQVTETPVRPREINPEIPAELDSLIMRALSKRPENRYESASDMLRVLERIDLSREAEGVKKKAFFGFRRKKGDTEDLSEQETVQELDVEYNTSFEEDGNGAIDSGSFEKVDLDECEEYDEADDAEGEVYFSSDETLGEDYGEQESDGQEYGEQEYEPAELGYDTEEEDTEQEIGEEEDVQELVPYNGTVLEEVEDEPTEYNEKHNKAKAATVYLVSLFAAAIVLAVSLFIYNSYKLYTVPFYTGADLEAAENDSVFSVTVKREFSRIHPAGQVISQSVAAGEKCRKGTEIILTVSDGPAHIRFSIPEGVDVDVLVSQLEGQIAEADYGISIVTEYEYSGTLAKGLCFAIDESVCAGGLLKIRVSAGTEKTYVEIPDFVGGKLSDAVEFLNENNVVFELVYGGGEGDVNTVLSQSIQSGKRTEAYVEEGKIVLVFGGRGN